MGKVPNENTRFYFASIDGYRWSRRYLRRRRSGFAATAYADVGVLFANANNAGQI